MDAGTTSPASPVFLALVEAGANASWRLCPERSELGQLTLRNNHLRFTIMFFLAMT